jgi:predicted MFS family arabinose efflux permease
MRHPEGPQAARVLRLLVELMGWAGFFVLCAVLAVPGMLLLFKVAPGRARIRFIDESTVPTQAGSQHLPH